MAENEKKVIDESNYQAKQPKPNSSKGPSSIGSGGDPLFRRIKATKEQLIELLDETTTVQDWVQRKNCNNVALAYLNNENLKETYYKIKDGFGEYGPLVLMGFKTPQGVEIPRLKLLDFEGNVLQVITGPMVIEELNKRALAYEDFNNPKSTYEVLEHAEEIAGIVQEEDVLTTAIQDYSGCPEDYI